VGELHLEDIEDKVWIINLKGVLETTVKGSECDGVVEKKRDPDLEDGKGLL
jgi:hypothetical protein